MDLSTRYSLRFHSQIHQPNQPEIHLLLFKFFDLPTPSRSTSLQTSNLLLLQQCPTLDRTLSRTNTSYPTQEDGTPRRLMLGPMISNSKLINSHNMTNNLLGKLVPTASSHTIITLDLDALVRYAVSTPS